MYSKKEVCFTVILALAALWYLGSQQITVLADGTHPPPPPWAQRTDVLQADGTHPPPPPWPQRTDVLQG
jgi:hypothetical protein